MTPNDTQRHPTTLQRPNLGLLGARALCHPTRPNRAKAPVLSDLFARSGVITDRPALPRGVPGLGLRLGARLGRVRRRVRSSLVRPELPHCTRHGPRELDSHLLGGLHPNGRGDMDHRAGRPHSGPRRISDAAPSDPGAWPTVKPRPPVLGPAGEPVCPGRVSHTSFGWSSAPPPQYLVGGQGPLPVTPNDTQRHFRAGFWPDSRPGLGRAMARLPTRSNWRRAG